MEKSLVLFNKTLSKALINEQAESAISNIREGNINALDAWCEIVALENMIKEIKKNIKDTALNEAEKYGSKTFSTHGANVTIKSIAPKYDYSVCGKWSSLEEQIQALKAEQKNVEESLQCIAKTGNPMVIDGEVVEAVPCSSDTTLAITFK